VIRSTRRRERDGRGTRRDRPAGRYSSKNDNNINSNINIIQKIRDEQVTFFFAQIYQFDFFFYFHYLPTFSRVRPLTRCKIRARVIRPRTYYSRMPNIHT